MSTKKIGDKVSISKGQFQAFIKDRTTDWRQKFDICAVEVKKFEREMNVEKQAALLGVSVEELRERMKEEDLEEERTKAVGKQVQEFAPLLCKLFSPETSRLPGNQGEGWFL